MNRSTYDEIIYWLVWLPAGFLLAGVALMFAVVLSPILVPLYIARRLHLVERLAAGLANAAGTPRRQPGTDSTPTKED